MLPPGGLQMTANFTFSVAPSRGSKLYFTNLTFYSIRLLKKFFFKFARARDRTWNLLVYFHLVFYALLLSYKGYFVSIILCSVARQCDLIGRNFANEATFLATFRVLFWLLFWLLFGYFLATFWLL